MKDKSFKPANLCLDGQRPSFRNEAGLRLPKTDAKFAARRKGMVINMTLETVCDEFNIEKSVMRYFADNEIVTHGELNDKELKAVSLMVLLLKAGLSKENVVQYFQCDDTQGGKNDKARILRTLRENMLDDIHKKQKQLDKIDYIIHDLRTF